MPANERIEQRGRVARIERPAERSNAMAGSVAKRAAHHDLRACATSEDERRAVDMGALTEKRRDRRMRWAVRDLIDRHDDERARTQRSEHGVRRAARIDRLDSEA